MVAERRRSIERDIAVSVDAGVVASLEAEGATLRTRLSETEAEAASLLPDADSLAEAEEVLANEEAALEARWGATLVNQAGDPAGEVRGS